MRDRFRRGQRNLRWLTTFDLATLEREKDKVSALLDEVESANKQISEHTASIESLRNDIATIEDEIGLMRAYVPYITNPDSAQLVGLNEQIATTRKSLQLYRSLQKELGGTDLQSYVEMQQPIVTAVSRMRSDLTSFHNEPMSCLKACDP